MNRLFSVIMFCLLTAASCNVKSLSDDHVSNQFRIKKISNLNSWYIIYATRGDSLYKIVSKKDKIEPANLERIVRGKTYTFTLVSWRGKEISDSGEFKIAPMNTLDIPCSNFDKETVICLEPKKGIYDIFFTEELNGLYYRQKSN